MLPAPVQSTDSRMQGPVPPVQRSPFKHGCEARPGNNVQTKCKRGFPFELAPAAKVDVTGKWLMSHCPLDTD